MGQRFGKSFRKDDTDKQPFIGLRKRAGHQIHNEELIILDNISKIVKVDSNKSESSINAEKKEDHSVDSKHSVKSISLNQHIGMDPSPGMNLESFRAKLKQVDPNLRYEEWIQTSEYKDCMRICQNNLPKSFWPDEFDGKAKADEQNEPYRDYCANAIHSMLRFAEHCPNIVIRTMACARIFDFLYRLPVFMTRNCVFRWTVMTKLDLIDQIEGQSSYVSAGEQQMAWFAYCTIISVVNTMIDLDAKFLESDQNAQTFTMPNFKACNKQWIWSMTYKNRGISHLCRPGCCHPFFSSLSEKQKQLLVEKGLSICELF